MARVDGIELTLEALQRFHPLTLVTGKDMDRVLAGASVMSLAKGQFLFRKTPPADVSYLLLEGEVEARESFDNRSLISASGSQARFALEHQARSGSSVRATTDCKILVLKREAMDALLAVEDDGGSFDVVMVEDTAERMEEARFDDEYSEDWMGRLLEAPLMSHLSATNIQRCFIELERVPFSAGQEVVKAGTHGDYFYILQQGEAHVITEEAGPYKGQTFDLVPGDYFGEEALVADTVRNATVRMVTDGVLGRLTQAQFDAIFKSSLIQTIDLAKARSFLSGAGIGYEIFDVRFPAEYRQAHVEGAMNMPVVVLRKRLREFDRNKTYLVTPEGGKRSELAVYLLRQAGLNAYLLNS